jgi:hypothetical protein
VAPLSFPSGSDDFGRFCRTASARQPSPADRRRRSHANNVSPQQLRHVPRPPAHKATTRSRRVRDSGNGFATNSVTFLRPLETAGLDERQPRRRAVNAWRLLMRTARGGDRSGNRAGFRFHPHPAVRATVSGPVNTSPFGSPETQSSSPWSSQAMKRTSWLRVAGACSSTDGEACKRPRAGRPAIVALNTGFSGRCSRAWGRQMAGVALLGGGRDAFRSLGDSGVCRRRRARRYVCGLAGASLALSSIAISDGRRRCCSRSASRRASNSTWWPAAAAASRVRLSSRTALA